MKTKLPALLVGALMLLTVPAAAQDSFVGFGTATGLELTGVQEGEDPAGLAFGFSEGAVQSTASEDACGADRGDACARGAGELLHGDTAEAHAPGNEGPDEAVGGELPEELSPLLDAAFGIGRAEASSGDVKRAHGSGAATQISVNVTETLVQEGEELFGPIKEGLEEFSESVLGPIAEGDPTEEVGPRLKETFDLLVENLGEAPLATITGGASETLATDEAGTTSVTATAMGTRILVMPFPDDVELPGDPDAFIEIEAGEATAVVSSERADASASADPAVVRLKLYDAAAGEFQEIAIEPGAEPVELGEDPLVVRIIPAGGATQVEDGGATAEAAAVRVELFSDPIPELRLALAHAQAAVNALAAPEPTPEPTPTPTPQADVPPQPDVPAPAPDLPRTGTGVAAAGLALLGLGAAGWYGVRRHRGL